MSAAMDGFSELLLRKFRPFPDDFDDFVVFILICLDKHDDPLLTSVSSIRYNGGKAY